jgi:acyl carrier protein
MVDFPFLFQVTVDAHFINDMGLDSLDVVDILMAFEDEFGKIYHEGTDTMHSFLSPTLGGWPC